MTRIPLLLAALFVSCTLHAQFREGTNWTKDGNGIYFLQNDQIVRRDLVSGQEQVIADPAQLTPKDSAAALKVLDLTTSEDESKILLFTNTKKVWRYHTRGDYWVWDIKAKTLKKLGKGLPTASLMYAKISPDNTKAAYVSKHNIYVEDLRTGKIKALSSDGTDRLINGTFDWVYEEEFGCRDGFRWSPDSRSIAYWQVDANKIRNFLMINNTDSIYSYTIPVEYPVVGQSPSPVRIGIVNVSTAKTTWMKIPGDPAQHYLVRMEWAGNDKIIAQQLNRKQNNSTLYYANAATGAAHAIYNEKDTTAWINTKSVWHDDDPRGWDWIENGKSFLWVTEKDGWRHVYKVSADGKQESLVTKGNYDVIDLSAIDEKSGYIYFLASPASAIQKYLYRTKTDGSGTLEPLSPAEQKGTHQYDISPNGHFAMHSFSNANTYPASELVALPSGKSLNGEPLALRSLPAGSPKVEFTQITTDDGVTMDAFISKPLHFDSTKKYPVVFYVYSEPFGTTVTDSYGVNYNRCYAGNMAQDGYVYISVEGRGTPVPKGSAWRKSIYKKVGILNVHDQAAAAKKILEWPWVDKDRIAVWGWSGGGSTTLHLLFEHPEIYKTGIAIAGVANQLTYDNVYEERYMGLVQEDPKPYFDGSPINSAKGLQGNLLIVHGTGDDNVHYQNEEMLLNELVKYNKQFQFMAYPNRTHSISEGAGTRKHLATLYTNFLQKNCPPGARDK